MAKIRTFLRLAAPVAACLFMVGPLKAQEAAKKIITHQTAFRIPFQLSKKDENRLTEVQLFVSENNGPWQQYGTTSPNHPPEKQNFIFRARQDGDYQFAVRTVDQRGISNPPDSSSFEPQLHVVVDSETPHIVLTPVPSSGGRVGVKWDVQDANLDIDSLRLEYRTEIDPDWKPVPGMIPKPFGEVTWDSGSASPVTVRCQVQDMAENMAHELVKLENAGPLARDTLGTGPPAIPQTDLGKGADPGKPWDQVYNDSSAAGNTYEPPSRGGKISANLDPKVQAGTEDSQMPDYAANSQRGAARQAADTRLANQGNDPRRYDRAGSYSQDRSIVGDPRITMNYEIEDVGSSGVSVVEVYATADNGRTWELAAAQNKPDPQGSAAYTVNVDLKREGLFGLTMVAKNGSGLGEAPPRPGDTPQSWVEVDLTKPIVQLYPPRVQEGTILIAWQAQDQNLGPRPVTLLYDAGQGSDIQVIAREIDNESASYVWSLRPGLPPRFRIGIQVTDIAGNAQISWSDELVVDSSRPRPRIIGIKPASLYR